MRPLNIFNNNDKKHFIVTLHDWKIVAAVTLIILDDVINKQFNNLLHG